MKFSLHFDLEILFLLNIYPLQIAAIVNADCSPHLDNTIRFNSSWQWVRDKQCGGGGGIN